MVEIEFCNICFMAIYLVRGLELESLCIGGEVGGTSKMTLLLGN